MPDPIKSGHAVFAEHMKRIESRHPEDLTARAIAEGKNPAAVALGRLGGLKGGKARAIKLSAKRRSEIASNAGKNSWKNRRD